MYRRLIYLIFFISISNIVQAQTEFFVGGSLSYGIPMNTYSGGGQYLRGLAGSSQAGIDLSGYIRFNNRIGLLGGIGQQFQYLHQRDHDFEERHPGYVSDVENTVYYVSLFSQLQFIQPFSSVSKTSLYVNAGFAYNIAGKSSISDQQFYPISSELVQVTTSYNQNNIALTAEVGLQHYLSQKVLLSGGINTQYSNSPLYKMDYTVTNGTKVITEDVMTSVTNFTGVKLSMHYKFAEIQRRQKPLKPHPEVPVTPPIIAQDTIHKDSVAGEIRGREVIVTHKVEVKSKILTIRVWDHQVVDGDIISLNLNGKWILENYTLEKKQHVMQVEIHEGENLFVLHALNLGKYTPNTAAIIIDDGITQNKVILESNLEQSGTIDIIFTP